MKKSPCSSTRTRAWLARAAPWCVARARWKRSAASTWCASTRPAHCWRTGYWWPGLTPRRSATTTSWRNVLAASAPASDGRLAADHAVAAATQSIVEALVDPDDIAALSVFLASDSANRFQGKPSRSTATLKPRSNTSPAPHGLTPPAGDVATAVLVRCGSADVWVSRSRSRAARVSGWVWRTCQAFGQDRDGETGGLSAAEPDVQVDTVGLVQGDVVDEADGACAVPLRRVGVGPECGEICC